MAEPVLGYWDIRGLAEPIRYLLHFKGVSFQDKRYQTNSDAWLKDKFQLNLDFPNLPYYIDGDIRMTQSLAILRHLARKYDLGGKSEKESLRVELAEQQIIDLSNSLATVCYNPDFEKLKPDFLKGALAQLKLFSTFLGDRKFFAGESITYVDFIAYDVFDFYLLFEPTILNDFFNLLKYQARFEKLPELQKYFKSSTYKRWPIYSPAAHFGGKGEEPKRVCETKNL